MCGEAGLGTGWALAACFGPPNPTLTRHPHTPTSPIPPPSTAPTLHPAQSKGVMDSQLFAISQLLALREHIAPFEADFAVVERDLGGWVGGGCSSTPRQQCRPAGLLSPCTSCTRMHAPPPTTHGAHTYMRALPAPTPQTSPTCATTCGAR
jgi:hypothetical protein